MHLRGRALGEWTLLTAFLVALAGLSSWQGWLWRADQVLYDTSLSFISRPVPDDILIVAIDEESLARIGRWPWRRAIHATLVEKLTQAEAATVGLDIILTEPDAADANGDRVLAEAIQRNGRVVLPIVPRSLAPGLLVEGLPIETFRRHAAALGHIEIPLDADGIARGVYLWGGVGEPRYPQLALAMLKVSRGGTAPEYEKAAAHDGDASTERGWYRDVWLHPQFAGPPGTYHTVSYVDVLTGAVPAERLRGRHVLVGATAEGLGDVYPTPMSIHGRVMPGVEIHATLLDALRSHATIDWLSQHQATIMTVAAIFVLMVGLLFLSPRDGLVLSAFFGLAAIVGAMLLLRWGNTWLPPSSVLLGAVLAYPLWSWRRLEAAQRFMDAELLELHATEPGNKAETPAERSIDPLENRIAIVRAAAERQRAVQKVRDDTMRFISHDIRSPLASIITIVEGARSQAASDNFRRLLSAGHYAQNALNLADDFFRLAKAETIDASKFDIVDLSSLAHEAADEVWPQAERKGVTVKVRDEGKRDALVRGNRAHLVRALCNLLDNAIKFSPENTPIQVVLRDDDRWQELDIIDQGCGIAPEDIGKLFTRYGRITKPDQPAQPGIGLGLVIVKTIVERHGGTITVNNAGDSGATFRMRLPRFAADVI
jgi:CHASE2 domain-containing sensor protein